MKGTLKEFTESIMSCFYLYGDTLEEKIVSAGKVIGEDYACKLRAALSEAGVGLSVHCNDPEAQKKMTREELAEEFGIMARGFIRMNELPHEEASRMIGAIARADPNAQEWANDYINHVCGVLQQLSNEVRRAGQEALQKNPAPRYESPACSDPYKTHGR